MDQKLTEILDLLEKDLKDIDSAVKHISNAQTAAEDVVKTGKEVTESFRKHLNEIQKSVNDLIQFITKKGEETFVKWDDYLVKFKELADQTEELVTYLKSVNFPARLDKIDTSISTLQQGILNNQNLLNELYKRLDHHVEKIMEYIDLKFKVVKHIKIFSIIILIIGLVSLVLSVSILIIR